MKKIVPLLLIFAVSAISSDAFSQERRGHRYAVPYHKFDRGFSTHYSWRESGCDSSWYRYRTRSTCFDIDPSRNVYVTEQHYTRDGVRYTRIQVFHSQHASQPFVTYYAHKSGGVRLIHSRRYHRHSGFHGYRWYHDDYHHPRWDHHRHYYVVEISWDTWQEKLFWGTYTSVLGADLLFNSNSTAGKILGGAALIGGLVKKAKGHEQRASELQAAILNETKDAEAENIRNL